MQSSALRKWEEKERRKDMHPSLVILSGAMISRQVDRQTDRKTTTIQHSIRGYDIFYFC